MAQTINIPGVGGVYVASPINADKINNIPVEDATPANGEVLVYNSSTGEWEHSAGASGSLEYKGLWNATTNSPTLSDATGTNNHYYAVSVAGTQDLGSGNLTFDVADWVIHNGTIWQRLKGSCLVTSVFTRTGPISAANNDYTWAQINKATSSIANITTRNHSDLVAGNGSDHSFIDQDVTIGASPSFLGDNFNNVPVTFPCRKGSAGTILKGAPVYISGYNVSGFIEVEECDADDPTKMPCLGLATASITNAAIGYVMSAGILAGFNTNSWDVGDDIYVSATVGTLTNVKPLNSIDGIQKVATVARKNVAVGTLIVFGAGRINDVPNPKVTTLASSSNITLIDLSDGADMYYIDLDENTTIGVSNMIKGRRFEVEIYYNGGAWTVALAATTFWNEGNGSPIVFTSVSGKTDSMELLVNNAGDRAKIKGVRKDEATV